MGIFKIIDNDVNYIELFIGFDIVVKIVIEVLDCLYFIVVSYSCIIILEVMGWDVGYIVLNVGIVGGVDVILILEIFYKIDNICNYICKC